MTKRLVLFIQVASGALIGIGVIVLFGWAFDIPFLKSLSSNLTSMSANTALSFVVFGIGLWAINDANAAQTRRSVAIACGAFVLAVGILTLSEYIFGWNLGIDELLVKVPDAVLNPGRMAPITAVSFILLGAALLLVMIQRYWLVQLAGLFVFLIGLLTLIGYLYGATSLYEVGAFTAVALHTATALLIAGAALLNVRPQYGLTAEITAKGSGGDIARRLLPAFVIVPIVIGSLRLRGQQAELYGTTLGLTLFTLTNIFIFGALIWWNARVINRVNAKRKKADEALLESERRYHRALDDLMKGAVIIDFDWCYIYINDAAASRGGKSKEKLIGKSMLELYPNIRSTATFDKLQKCMTERTADQFESEIVYANGEKLWVALSVQPIPEGIFILSLDISEQKRSQTAIKHYAQRMEILHEIDIGIINAKPVGEIVQTVLKLIQQLVECQRVHVSLVNETGDEAVIFALAIDGETELAQGTHVPVPPKIFEGYSINRVRVVNDLRLTEADNPPVVKRLLSEGYLSAISTVLTNGDEPAGVLFMFSDRLDYFTVEHQEIAVEIAHQLSIAIQQLQLSRKIVQHRQTVEGLHQFLQTTLDAFPANTIVLDADGTIITVNVPWKQFVEENGANTENHYLGSNYLEICQPATGMHAEKAKEAAVGISAVMQGKREDFYLEYPCGKPNPIRWFMLRVTPFAEPTPRRVVVAHLDISDHKEAELALKESHDTLEQRVRQRTAELQAAKDRVEAILNNNASGIVFVHSDFTIQQTNPAFNQIFACANDDYFDQPLTTLLHPDDMTRIISAIQMGMADRVHALSLETRAYRRNRREFDAELRIGFIKADGFVCAIQDISERKAQERQLRYFASLQENVTDAVIASDLNHHIQSWNKAAERIYGWRAEEVIGRTTHEVLQMKFASKEDEAKTAQDFAEQGYWTSETVQQRKDGSTVEILSSVVEFKDENGQRFGIVSVHHDITERKAHEKQLRYHASLQENVSDAVIVTDIEFRIQSWNQAAERIYGWRADEVIGRLAPEILKTDFETNDEREMGKRTLNEQGWWAEEVVQRHKSGDPRYILGSVSLVRDENGMPFGVVSVNRDISERKEAEGALKRSEQLLRMMLDNMPVGVWMVDANGNITLTNPAGHQTWAGVKYLGMEHFDEYKAWKLDTGERLKSEDWAMSRAVTKGDVTINEELEIEAFDGVHKYLLNSSVPIRDDHGNIIGAIAVTQDITEQKRISAELDRQRAFLRQVIDVSPSMIFVKDYEGHFLLANPMVARMYNISVEELIGKTNADLNDTQETRAFSQADRQVISSGEPMFIEESVTSEDGEKHWLQTTKVPIASADGKSNHVLGIATDITARKKSEEALQLAFEREKELGELKSRFVSMASHEFRTPLATILALTETLIAYRQKLPDDQIEVRLVKIKDQVDHLKDIMEDVLLLARMQARRVEFNPAYIDLDALCRSVIDEFQSRPDVTHKIAYSCDERLQEVALDKKLMRQIINNLVSNAVKYSMGDKTVTVRLTLDDGHVSLKVQDEGIGIPEADMKYIFEPFHRATNVGTISGTGLGMVITKESVELHGGTITIESQVGVGTTFTVRIPLTQVEPL